MPVVDGRRFLADGGPSLRVVAAIERAGIELREGVESEWTMERSQWDSQKGDANWSTPTVAVAAAAADAGRWPGMGGGGRS